MSRLYLIVDNKDDWSPFYPSEDVITFEEYLNLQDAERHQRVRVINLCRSYKYLSNGYYCSLLAEARGHHVIPSVRVLNDIEQRALFILQTKELENEIEKAARTAQVNEDGSLVIHSWFGTSDLPGFDGLTRQLFERFPCPALSITVRKRRNWEVTGLKPLSITAIRSDPEQTAFANALDQYSRKIWRTPRTRKAYKYDLAILVNPEEKLPPSDKTALRKFVKAANKLGADVDLITHRDYLSLAEYDALFIRETTAIDHHTYRFAKKAEKEGLVVIDDPTSILRCTNKVYLADLFRRHKVPAPRTCILSKSNPASVSVAMEELGFPMVLKIPDGSFSLGVKKVENEEELRAAVAEMHRKSALVLAQEFMYTEYDWRIGVLNHKPLYACRYYMARNHWQIYHHGQGGTRAGAFDTLPTYEVPKPVIQAALKATRPIGNSLYGVDIKQSGNKAYVIEVNDNPSIESGVEDKFLGDELYTQIIGEILNRVQNRRDGT